MTATTSRRLPTGTVQGRVRVPVSKSVAQRVLNLSLLAERPLVIDNPPSDQDSLAFAGALRALGWQIEELAPGWRLTPAAQRPPAAVIDCGSSGTALRFLLAALSTLPGSWTLRGSNQLAARPIQGLVESLRSAGVDVRVASDNGNLPVKVVGGDWNARKVTLNAGTSSQYLSAMLMASTRVSRPVTLHVQRLVSAPYVDLTLDLLDRFGATVDRGVDWFEVRPGLQGPERVRLEADWSSAAYPAAAAVLTGGVVQLEGLSSTSAQGDRALVELLREMGADSSWDHDLLEVGGSGDLKAVRVDMGSMPDQVPTLACLAPFAAGVTEIRGVAHLRHKESDRLAALARELRRLGAEVEELTDGLRIPGVWSRGSTPGDEVLVDPEGDHRIAMAIAVLATRRPGVRLDNPLTVDKSYPGFWQDWATLTS